MTKLLAISGRIASGKTTVALGLGEGLNWKVVSFGNVVRMEARKRNSRSLTRKLLQDVGQELVATDVQLFCRNCLLSVDFRRGENLILDGLRHLEVLQAVQVQTGSSFVRLAHLKADLDVRKNRFAAAEAAEDFVAADCHPVEAGNDMLEGQADFRLDTSALTPAFAKSAVLTWALSLPT